MARKIHQVESEQKKVKDQSKNVQKLLQKAAKKTVASHARDTKKKANKNKKKD